MLEANKKKVPPKSCSLKIRIHSVNQILRNKEKVTWTRNINTDQNYRSEDSVCIYSCLPYNKKLRNCSVADNRKYFSCLSLRRNLREAHMFYLAWEVGKIWRYSCGEKGNVITINEFKYGQTWKIWPSPLSLSLCSTFYGTYFGMKFWVPSKVVLHRPLSTIS